MLMLPELIVIAAAFAVLLADLLVSDRQRKLLAPIAAVGLALAAVVLFANVPDSGEMLGGRFAMSPVAWWFKAIFLLAALVTVALSADMLDGRTLVHTKGTHARGEYYTILLFTVAGMMYLASARDI